MIDWQEWQTQEERAEYERAGAEIEALFGFRKRLYNRARQRKLRDKAQ